MGLLLKPNIKVADIKMDMDANSSAVPRVLNEFGKNIPLVKIGDYVLKISELTSLNIKVGLNSLPSFSMTIDDSTYHIRETLKKEIDEGVIFIGYKTWYIKFNMLITTVHSDAGDSHLDLNGIIFNDKLFQTEQKSYRDQSVSDILLDVCKKTNMGLFTFNNTLLNQKIDYILNTEVRFIDFITDNILKYTDNIFAYDLFYHLHIGNIESIRKQPIDKYTLAPTGETIAEKDMIFSSKTRYFNAGVDDFKLPINFYTLNSNFSKTFLDNASNYKVGIPGTNQKEIKSDNKIGYGSIGTNTFPGFANQKFPFYSNIVNKALGGNVITIELKQLMFELSPFSVVGIEIYLPETGNKQFRLDYEHSGKKVVIGWSLDYEKKDEKVENGITQTINLI